MSHAAGEPAAAGTALHLYRPPPAVPGLKLDWHSALGSTGVLLDWETAEPMVDGGVPPAVRALLAAGLAAAGTVAACTTRVADDVGRDWTRVPQGYDCRLPGGLLARRRSVAVRATRDLAEVARFFDETLFDWAQESQLLLLAPPGPLPDELPDVLPTLDRALVDGCLAQPMTTTPDQLRAAGLIGIVRPGVDGGMAGLYVPDAAARAAVLGALATAARVAGAAWLERDGAEHWAVGAARRR